MSYMKLLFFPKTGFHTGLSCKSCRRNSEEMTFVKHSCWEFWVQKCVFQRQLEKKLIHLTLWNHEHECWPRPSASDCDYKRQITSQPRRTEVYKNKAIFLRKVEPFFILNSWFQIPTENFIYTIIWNPVLVLSILFFFLTIFKMWKGSEVGGGDWDFIKQCLTDYKTLTMQFRRVNNIFYRMEIVNFPGWFPEFPFNNSCTT